MPITIDGSGTITGLSAGGLPDATIVTADIADANITAAKLDGAQSGSAPIYAARAWVNFNGTGTVAIRASGNVSSITDNGTGNYTVNFTVAMTDANYSANITAGGNTVGRQPITSASVDGSGNTVAPTTSAFRFNVVIVSITNTDADYLNVAIFR
jgi:hypothetical protein